MAALTAEQQKEFVDAFRELATETGVDGVPRLVALFSKRNGDVGLGQSTLTKLAREALQTKASKQILQFPRESTSGGAVHAIVPATQHTAAINYAPSVSTSMPSLKRAPEGPPRREGGAA